MSETTTLTHRSRLQQQEELESRCDGRKRILLVEGDGFTRLVLLLRLRLAGFSVDFTSNGILGLGKLRNSHPDMLLLDLKLCGLSGLELIKAARDEAGFGERPIFVYTHAERMNRATRKEIGLFATKVFDKKSVTREEVVQFFANTFPTHRPRQEQQPDRPRSRVAERTAAAPAVEVANETVAVPAGAIEELIAGVRQKSDLLARCSQTGYRAKHGIELHSRVCSLASCAEAAGLPNLARHANALERFLGQLGKDRQAYTDAALNPITRAVEVMSRMSFKPTGKTKVLSRFTAVLIDEWPPSGKALKEALQKEGFDSIYFEAPEKAREHLGQNATQLIVANVPLPEAHGLSLNDIRQMPLHAKTPLLVGPEPTIKRSLAEDLPTNAAQLQTEPMLMAQLVLSALNEVQSPGPSSGSSNPAVSAPRVAQPVHRAAAVLTPALDDGFELFAPSASKTQAAPPMVSTGGHKAPAHVQAASWAAAQSLPADTALEQQGEVQRAAAAAPAQPERPAHELFTVADIPEGPFFRVKPAARKADNSAEVVPTLPVAPTEFTQADERAVEVVPLSNLQPAPEEQPEPEHIPQDQVTEVVWKRAAAPNTSSRETNASAPEFQQNQAAEVETSTAAIPNHGEVMNNQLEAAPAEYVQSQDGGGAAGQSNSRPDLATRVCEAEMALYHAQSQIERRDKMIEALQKQLAEGSAGQGQNGNGSSPTPAQQKAEARCAELEQELASLRQAFEDFNGDFGQQQQTATETGKQVQELETQLNQKTAELQNHQAEHARVEAELRTQLAQANAAGEQDDNARQQAQARCAQLEQEVNLLRQAREELTSKLAQEQKASADIVARVKELENQAASAVPGDSEQQLHQYVAALARATAELARERGERQRCEQRAAELNARLQTLHEDFRRTLQAQHQDLARIAELEEQQRQTTKTLEQRTAELEQQQDERRLAEEQLQKAKELNVQLRKDAAFFEEANRKFDGARQELQNKLEASLAAAREHQTRLQQEQAERQRLSDNLEATQRELQTQTRHGESLEQELQNARASLQETEAHLQKETAERQRLSEALQSLQRNDHAGSERDLEFSKLRAALQHEQVERKRQESQLAHLRHNALDSAQAARALRTSMRRQIREPVDNLIQSTRSLLELEMTEAQKKLAESVLQDVLLVQTRLREPELAQDAPADQAAEGAVS